MTEATLEHPGATLKEARQRLGASVADIANALHLKDEVVVALEEGQHDRLPPPVYVVGYVRAYARLVDLNEETLRNRIEAAMPKVVPAPGSSPATVVPRPRATLGERAQRNFGAIIALVVLLVAIGAASALWWASGYYDWSFPNLGLDEQGTLGGNPVSTTEEISSPTVSSPVTVSSPSTLSPSSPSPSSPNTLSPSSPSSPRANIDTLALALPARTAPSPVGVDTGPAEEPFAPTLATIGSPVDTSEPVDAGAPADTSEAAIKEPISAFTPVPAPALDDLAPDTLAFQFNEASWVEVHDGDGELIHAELGQTGQTISVQGDAPFSILVGYAAGVQMTFNGDAVALTPHTRRSVARLVVGH